MAAVPGAVPAAPGPRAPPGASSRPPAAQDALDVDSNTDREQTLPLHGDGDNWIDFSKMCTSNQEYYLKLEELKNAHLETMAKLESMYRNKLYLKGVQPVARKDAASNGCCSWKVLLSPFPSSPAFRTTRKKQKAWSPKVTVPKPFQMTIREARKKEQNVKSKSQIEMENNLLKKQLEEEAECQKKFRANPVPAAVFLPLYHEIIQRNEERQKSVKERSKLKLLASQKPFKFIEREKQRNEIRKMQLRDLSTPEKKPKPFKAKPIPKCVYSPAVNDKLQEEELYREIRIRMRAEELLRNSSLPTSRLALKNTNKKKKHKCIEPKETEHKPKIKPDVPDFERLHQKFQKRLSSCCISFFLNKFCSVDLSPVTPLYLKALELLRASSQLVKQRAIPDPIAIGLHWESANIPAFPRTAEAKICEGDSFSKTFCHPNAQPIRL